jgi:hypothetical protein
MQYKKLLETCESLADALVQCNMLLQHAECTGVQASQSSHIERGGGALPQPLQAIISPGPEGSPTPVPSSDNLVTTSAEELTPSNNAECINAKSSAQTILTTKHLHQQLERILQPVSLLQVVTRLLGFTRMHHSYNFPFASLRIPIHVQKRLYHAVNGVL